MSLIDNIIARAKSNRQRIVLPESLEERTITAADKALADEIADIILIGDRSEILALADRLGLKNIGKATIIDPKTSEKTEEYAQLLFQLRQKSFKIRLADRKIRRLRVRKYRRGGNAVYIVGNALSVRVLGQGRFCRRYAAHGFLILLGNGRHPRLFLR